MIAIIIPITTGESKIFAPLHRALLQAAQGIFEALDIDVGRVQAVEQTGEHVEKVVVHRGEERVNHVRVCVDRGIGNALLEIVRAAQPSAFEDGRIENGHGIT